VDPGDNLVIAAAHERLRLQTVHGLRRQGKITWTPRRSTNLNLARLLMAERPPHGPFGFAEGSAFAGGGMSVEREGEISDGSTGFHC